MVFIDRKVALTSLFSAVFFPYQAMAPLFGAYSELEKGNGLPLYHIFAKSSWNLTVTCQDCSYPVAQAGVSPDVVNSIQCADTGAQSDDLTSLRSIYDAFAAQTQLADIAMLLAGRCVYAVPDFPT